MSGFDSDGREQAAAIEAVLTVATEPVTTQLLAELLEVGPERIDDLCTELARSYEEEERGFELVRVAGGYRIQSHPAYRNYVERFILDDAPRRLSPAALETLAIVAYKQPISRGQIGAIRGVNPEGVMRVLVERGYVQPVGHDSGPGQAVLFGTTTEFLERLGLDSLAGLPPLEHFVPDAEVVEGLERVLRSDPGE